MAFWQQKPCIWLNVLVLKGLSAFQMMEKSPLKKRMLNDRQNLLNRPRWKRSSSLFANTQQTELVFTARCHVSAVLAMGLCLTVCLSVTSRCFIETVKRIELGIGMWASFHPSYTVLKENSDISKNKGTSLWNFVLNSGLRKFRHRTSYGKGHLRGGRVPGTPCTKDLSNLGV